MITLSEICMSVTEQTVETKARLRDPASVVLLERNIDLAIQAFNAGNDEAMRVYIKALRVWTNPQPLEMAS